MSLASSLKLSVQLMCTGMSLAKNAPKGWAKGGCAQFDLWLLVGEAVNASLCTEKWQVAHGGRESLVLPELV